MDFESMNVFGKNNGYKKMSLKDFVRNYNIELASVFKDIERSWNTYRNVRSRARDINKCKKRWLYENKDWIKPIVSEIAKSKYHIQIV